MDLQKMIAELEAERNRLDQAIIALEHLSAGKIQRRGRPPGWLKNEIERVTSERGVGEAQSARSSKTAAE